MILLTALLLLLAAAFLFGYTTIQIPVKREEGKSRLACVGDSITYGCTLPLFFKNRYPALLQAMLGESVRVGAFAVNDRTAQDSGNKPIRRTRAYQRSLRFRPDTVVILLGTNDSKDKNWRSEAEFRRQYQEILREFRALDTSPRILLCTPPRGYVPINLLFHLSNDSKLSRIPEIAEIVRGIAGEEGLELVDLYALTEHRRELLGPDGLHPSRKGARAIAEAVYDKL